MIDVEITEISSRAVEKLCLDDAEIGLLIQVMASFEPLEGTSLRNRITSIDHNQLTLAVES